MAVIKRNVIKIDEDKCVGCGDCIPDCPEGALQLIDGKARLISDLFCDGLGACVGSCQFGAMTVEEREAEPYDESKVMPNIVHGGRNVIKAHLKHLKDHGENGFYAQSIEYLKQNNIEIPQPDEEKPLACGCPGMMQKDLTQLRKGRALSQQKIDGPSIGNQSELNNWPVQLKLLNPNATYFHNVNLLIAADCTAFAYSNFHSRFLKDKILIMFCPKLDSDLDVYVAKLAQIFEMQNIQSVSIVHMQVPCCGGVEMIVVEAMKRANKNIVIRDYTISITGELI